jgi:hypothetical protein
LTRTQSIAHNTYVDVTDYTESYDPDGFYPGSGTTVTLPAALGGVYIISFSGLWAAASGVSGGSLVVNGAGFAGAHSAPMATFSAAVVVALAGGATVRGQVYHNVGVATNVSARLCLQRIAV